MTRKAAAVSDVPLHRPAPAVVQSLGVASCACGAPITGPFSECARCYRDAKGPFEFERSDE